MRSALPEERPPVRGASTVLAGASFSSGEVGAPAAVPRSVSSRQTPRLLTHCRASSGRRRDPDVIRRKVPGETSRPGYPPTKRCCLLVRVSRLLKTGNVLLRATGSAQLTKILCAIDRSRDYLGPGWKLTHGGRGHERVHPRPLAIGASTSGEGRSGRRNREPEEGPVRVGREMDNEHFRSSSKARLLSWRSRASALRCVQLVRRPSRASGPFPRALDVLLCSLMGV
jgi:hypothetical protein